ncbi:drug/metabolite transporter (DMT)-like permease [Shimia isoporae]|uniref:Drug/metabolite transporter (DMT)-like permease n=1 Tax=Shimia isoporae TaxID=647720 RepID=A0A4R1N5U1_9RHOB|nr:DMT family transporter [Shimia isoporae]TCL01480.1 drug/metabolite transporter (DMT)-like permease [Shimia isoporae]
MTGAPDNRRGILLMCLTTFVFAMQDGFSRHLAETYNTYLVVMIRYWFFAAFVIALAIRQEGGLKRVMQSRFPVLQSIRGALLALEICVTVAAFTLLGLTETHAVFICYPLMIAALSGPVLGEQVGWRRWLSIGIGAIGVMIILQPGSGVFSPVAAIPLLGALMFAIYGLLTRYVSRGDSSETSLFYTGTVGCILMTAIGVFFWEPMTGQDWIWMLMLCVSGVFGHWLLIKTYEAAEASAVQPFAYLQLPFAAALGMVAFGETLRVNVAVGAAVVVGAGLFTWWREQSKRT